MDSTEDVAKFDYSVSSDLWKKPFASKYFCLFNIATDLSGVANVLRIVHNE